MVCNINTHPLFNRLKLHECTVYILNITTIILLAHTDDTLDVPPECIYLMIVKPSWKQFRKYNISLYDKLISTAEPCAELKAVGQDNLVVFTLESVKSRKKPKLSEESTAISGKRPSAGVGFEVMEAMKIETEVKTKTIASSSQDGREDGTIETRGGVEGGIHHLQAETKPTELSTNNQAAEKPVVAELPTGDKNTSSTGGVHSGTLQHLQDSVTRQGGGESSNGGHMEAKEMAEDLTTNLGEVTRAKEYEPAQSHDHAESNKANGGDNTHLRGQVESTVETEHCCVHDEENGHSLANEDSDRSDDQFSVARKDMELNLSADRKDPGSDSDDDDEFCDARETLEEEN